RDAGGQPVAADPGFPTCLANNTTYCSALSLAMKNSVRPPASSNVVAASLFTTMSATAWLEQARKYVDANPPGPATILATAALSNLTNITWVPQGTTTSPENVPLAALPSVGSIAFGAYYSPDFLYPLDGTIHTTPTAQPLSPPYASIPVSFHVFLP